MQLSSDFSVQFLILTICNLLLQLVKFLLCHRKLFFLKIFHLFNQLISFALICPKVLGLLLKKLTPFLLPFLGRISDLLTILVLYENFDHFDVLLHDSPVIVFHFLRLDLMILRLAFSFSFANTPSSISNVCH